MTCATGSGYIDASVSTLQDLARQSARYSLPLSGSGVLKSSVNKASSLLTGGVIQNALRCQILSKARKQSPPLYALIAADLGG
jgi:hypothetical protein